MDPLEDLASAASQRSPYRRRAPARRTKVQHSSAPLVLAIIFGSIVIGGAIIYLATRSTGPANPQTPTDTSSVQNQANEAATAEVKAQVADFKEFASRLAEELGQRRKAALQAENTSSDLVITYTVHYMVKHLGTENAANGRPTTFLAQFAGSYDGKGEGYTSKDTCELTAGFVFDPSGRWKIASATERPLTHSTSGDFMGVPEKGGAKRAIANVDWFNAAVNQAQKGSPTSAAR